MVVSREIVDGDRIHVKSVVPSLSDPPRMFCNLDVIAGHGVRIFLGHVGHRLVGHRRIKQILDVLMSAVDNYQRVGSGLTGFALQCG